MLENFEKEKDLYLQYKSPLFLQFDTLVMNFFSFFSPLVDVC